MPADIDECLHGMGDPAWCTLCNGRDQRAAQLEQTQAGTRDRDVPVINAQRESECPLCHLTISVGARIARNQLGRWAHANCTA